MAKRYRHEDVEITTKTINVFDCPNCGFEFNACHEMDDESGGWVCPLCEIEELKTKIEHYEKALIKIAFVGFNGGDSSGNVDFDFSEEGHSKCIDIALEAIVPEDY